MEQSAASDHSARVLGLGNELLADDAFGILAAREIGRCLGGTVEVVVSSDAGFNLLEHLLGVSRLMVVDTVLSGGIAPGTTHVLDERSLQTTPGQSPHFVGLLEVLTVARRLGLAVPDRLAVVTVAARDCSTVGGPLHPAVRAAIPKIVKMARGFFQ